MPFRARYDIESGTGAILECLAGHGAKAVFFTVGALALERPDLVAEIARAGHEVALHGWRHEHLEYLSASELGDFSAGLQESEDAIESLTGRRPDGFRAPYLLGPRFFRPDIYAILHAHGYRWTSNREIRRPVELLRPDRLRTALPWRLAASNSGALPGEIEDVLTTALNAPLWWRDRVGGSRGAARQWLKAGSPPFWRGRILEIPVYSPLDCDLIGLPDPASPTSKELLRYARFALLHSLNQPGPLTMLTFHDWIVSGGNRMLLLERLLSTLDQQTLSATTVEASWPDLIQMAVPDPDRAKVRVYDPSYGVGSSGTEPSISVVICTHNGERDLPRVLESLWSQSLPRNQFEVIVVDDGSTDASSEIARGARARVVRLDTNAGLAAARNAGVSAARGEIVAFTDDDCEADRRWLATLLAAFSDPQVDGVGGLVRPYSEDPKLLRYLELRNPLTPLSGDLLNSRNLVYRLRLYLRSTILGDTGLRPGDQLCSVVGANMAFRRHLVHELDGFDEAFRFGGEEEDFCRRRHDRPGGLKLRYQPEAIVIHRFASGFGDLLRRARAYGVGNARAVLKHSQIRPIVYPFPIGIMIAAILAAVRRSGSLAVAAAVFPAIVYPRWITTLRRGACVEPVLYPYIQAAQEVCTMLGEVDGFRAGYEALPSRYLDPEQHPEPEALGV